MNRSKIYTSWLRKDSVRSFGGFTFRAKNSSTIEVFDPKDPKKREALKTEGGVAFYPPSSMIYTTKRKFVPNDELKKVVNQYHRYRESYKDTQKLIVR